jgi:hypothetical protein
LAIQEAFSVAIMLSQALTKSDHSPRSPLKQVFQSSYHSQITSRQIVETRCLDVGKHRTRNRGQRRGQCCDVERNTGYQGRRRYTYLGVASEVWVRSQASGLRNWQNLGRAKPFAFRAALCIPPRTKRKQSNIFPRGEVEIVIDQSASETLEQESTCSRLLSLKAGPCDNSHSHSGSIFCA